MKAIEYNAILPKNISLIVMERGLKQGVVAERAGFSPKEFSDMLNGRRIIKVSDILKIATVLGVTPNELFGVDNRQQKSA